MGDVDGVVDGRAGVTLCDMGWSFDVDRNALSFLGAGVVDDGGGLVRLVVVVGGLVVGLLGLMVAGGFFCCVGFLAEVSFGVDEWGRFFVFFFVLRVLVSVPFTICIRSIICFIVIVKVSDGIDIVVKPSHKTVAR